MAASSPHPQYSNTPKDKPLTTSPSPTADIPENHSFSMGGEHQNFLRTTDAFRSKRLSTFSKDKKIDLLNIFDSP